MKKNPGFSLMELLITMSIASLLAVVGISGYMQSLIRSRRNDAVTSLQRSLLAMNNTSTTATINCPYSATTILIDSTSDTCKSENGFYILNYNADGFTTVANEITNNLIENEKVILKATAITNKSQGKDSECQTIYLTDMGNVLPKSCAR